MPNDDARPRRLRIPNLEVKRLFPRELVDRSLRLAGSQRNLDALHRAVASSEAPA